jgi:ubiquinone/menaquinone biosynthesis C-methylase UbiE
MQTPPICNYEGSDYQTSFWERGGREYEDGVEAVALRKLLPPSGRLMLELGAGAGRNTLRYQGYERIVLVDYARSQLFQARQRLGDNPRYIYVAADIYKLPFVAGLFDGATCIRTLHHLADARKALESINKCLSQGGILILECANKRNLKAILRYALRRQTWNPFSPEPVEFAPLNYDFHPDTLRAWLKLSGFAIQRQLSVSHLRFPLLKKLLPLRLLVWLDSVLQETGGLVQLTPSLFFSNRNIRPTLPAADGTFFYCPACGTDLADTPPQLNCTGCGRTWPVVDGIYDFRVDPPDPALQA